MKNLVDCSKSVGDLTTSLDLQSCQESIPDDNLQNSNLFIAVESAKVLCPTSIPQEPKSSYVTAQVSPLDPNMSSVARYSPVLVQYPDNQIDPIVIHQLVNENKSAQAKDAENNVVLCDKNIKSLDNQFFNLVNDNVDICDSDALQLVRTRDQQGVELLITDHTTGISYSVNAQELLVERCLEDDQRLLETLVPGPILESDLLALDENTLKSELNNGDNQSTVVTSINEEVINNYINCLSKRNSDAERSKMQTRSGAKHELDREKLPLYCVYSIMDKPILPRARATLPEAYLCITKINEENVVLAKKMIPGRTQFGPLEGVFVPNNCDIEMADESDDLRCLITIKGNIYNIDVSDEHASNWMKFVRKASSFEEQNLVMTEEEGGLYYYTTKNVLPKEELKVGYSTAYAERYNLKELKPAEVLNWPCYECSFICASSEELQRHLEEHDKKIDENLKPKKKCKKKFFLSAKSDIDVVECNVCQHSFSTKVNFNTLKSHLLEEHRFSGVKIRDYFSIQPNFECDICHVRFRMESLLNIHKLEHDPDLALDYTNHVCPQCQRKFPTRRQLVVHVTYHVIPSRVKKEAGVRCDVCYKLFSHQTRLQKHMSTHGSEDSKPLQCKVCKRRFLTKSALAAHAVMHSGGDFFFVCPICNETFDHVLKLKWHIPKHAQNDQFACPHCQKSFKKYSVIRKHIRAFHGERKLTCQHCPATFSTEDLLKKHMLKHSDHREFLCSECGRQFKRKDKLKDHVKKIHPEGRFKEDGGRSGHAKRAPFSSKAEPTDFHRFIYKCHTCLVGFKRRGMLVNHLAKRHPDITPDSVPELNLPILQTTKDYYCQYCDKVYKSSTKRKVHILKNHPGAALPVNNRQQGNSLQGGAAQPTYSQTVGSVTTRPKNCRWCHKQYASKAKLQQHVRKEHPDEPERTPDFRQDPERIEPLESDANLSDLNSDEFKTKLISNGRISGTNKCLGDEDSKYCGLLIDENGASEGLNGRGPHLYDLLSSNNGSMPTC